MMALVLGIDPGIWTGLHGWALLEAGPGLFPRWLSSGYSSAEAILGDLVPAAPALAQVAIETAAGYVWAHYKGADLLSMNRVAGYLQGRLESMGLEVVSPASQDWRRVVCGKGAASDEMVSRALRTLVLGVPHSAKVHALDAAGAALAVARGWRPVPEQLRLAQLEGKKKAGRAKARKGKP